MFKTTKVRTLQLRTASFAIFTSLTGCALAQQDYPNKPIRFIVPYAPGGSTSYISRLVGQRLTESWGQQVIIDNRPGANTMIGTQMAVKSRPDGYTLLYIGSALAGNQTLAQAPYDAIKDIAPIATVASFECLLVVTPSLPVTTLKELIALAKARPGQINYASSSSGGVTHLAPELFNSVAGIKTQHIPYKGGGPAITDLVGGQVQFMMSPPINVVGHVKNGRLRAIAISGESRLATLPQVPTFAEAGLPGVSLQSWQGVAAPAGTAKVVLDRISAEVAKLVALPETHEKLELQGFVPYYNNAEQTAQLVKGDIIKYGKIIKDAKIQSY
jgi:tripartite-type tricarboxylate transporter receptor subunit TctC